MRRKRRAVAIVSIKEPGHFKTSAAGYLHGMLAKVGVGELNLDRTIWKLRTAANPPGNTGRVAATGFRRGTYPRPSHRARPQESEEGVPWSG